MNNGETFSEEDLVVHVLNFLPKNWDILAKSIIYKNDMPS